MARTGPNIGKLSLAVALLVPSAAGAQAPKIQPGDWVTNGEQECSLGWLFDGSDGAVYFSSVAHCARLGREVRVAQDPGANPPVAGNLLGRYSHLGVTDTASTPDEDVALIRVRDEMRDRVDGTLRGHPGVPKGVITTAEAAAGDVLRFAGWGSGFEGSAGTRERRQGVYVQGDEWAWSGPVPTAGGDSGGPVAHAATGHALGLNKGGSCGSGYFTGCWQYGPTIAALQRLAGGSGLVLKLRVADAAPPASPVGDRPAPGTGGERPKAPAAEPARASVVLKPGTLSARTIRQRKRLKVTVASSRPLSGVTLLLTRCKRAFAGGATGSLSGGAITLKSRRGLVPGRYRLILNATDDLGRAVRAVARVRVRR
jgi:hypothetical protein